MEDNISASTDEAEPYKVSTYVANIKRFENENVIDRSVIGRRMDSKSSINERRSFVSASRDTST